MEIKSQRERRKASQLESGIDVLAKNAKNYEKKRVNFRKYAFPSRHLEISSTSSVARIVLYARQEDDDDEEQDDDDDESDGQNTRGYKSETTAKKLYHRRW